MSLLSKADQYRESHVATSSDAIGPTRERGAKIYRVFRGAEKYRHWIQSSSVAKP